jgi:hypothetical protein
MSKIDERSSDETAMLERTQEHLTNALETGDPDEKDYHVRTALQFLVIEAEER